MLLIEPIPIRGQYTSIHNLLARVHSCGGSVSQSLPDDYQDDSVSSGIQNSRNRGKIVCTGGKSIADVNIGGRRQKDIQLEDVPHAYGKKKMMESLRNFINVEFIKIMP